MSNLVQLEVLEIVGTGIGVRGFLRLARLHRLRIPKVGMNWQTYELIAELMGYSQEHSVAISSQRRILRWLAWRDEINLKKAVPNKTNTR